VRCGQREGSEGEDWIHHRVFDDRQCGDETHGVDGASIRSSILLPNRPGWRQWLAAIRGEKKTVMRWRYHIEIRWVIMQVIVKDY